MIGFKGETVFEKVMRMPSLADFLHSVKGETQQGERVNDEIYRHSPGGDITNPCFCSDYKGGRIYLVYWWCTYGQQVLASPVCCPWCNEASGI